MCLNNIGCLNFKQGKFLDAAGKFEEARQLGKEANEHTADASVRQMGELVQMSRIFQRGYSLYAAVSLAFNVKTLFTNKNCKKCKK
jgi:hypothetical protein